MRLRASTALVLAATVWVAPAARAGDPGLAAAQVALYRRGLYHGTIDGESTPATQQAVRAFQRRRRLAVDGIVGPRTRRAFGPYSRHLLGSRVLGPGQTGWDVAALQFVLAAHGFPCGPFDGIFGPHLSAALRHFQRYAGVGVDGRAGPATLAALRLPPPTIPFALAWPVQGFVGSPFGPRGDGFHPGIDIPEPWGTPVAAAAPGTVSFADYDDGYGKLVVVAHGYGVRTFYAHLSAILVGVGESVSAGSLLGRVGSTGESTGPHLHFEVRVRGAAVDPLPALP
jgi:murein DD-endopeptidase MepM/ murein hydrolase activator NlpD